MIIGKTAGFCFGVSNAVTKAEKALEESENIYCLGELAHNGQVIEDLTRKGIIFIDDIENAKEKLIIRAHGVTKQIYEQAKQKEIELIDLTCPKVLKIHETAEEYADNNYYVLLMGEASHPETIGTISYCGKAYSLIEDIKDIEKAVEKLEENDRENVLVISQTTFSLEKFNEIVNILEQKLNSKNLKVINTLCDATKQRQIETAQIAKEVEMMIIVGGKNSSNTRKLSEISQKYCENVILIETKNELELENINRFSKIGIMAGASTPQKSINEVVAILK